MPTSSWGANCQSANLETFFEVLRLIEQSEQQSTVATRGGPPAAKLLGNRWAKRPISGPAVAALVRVHLLIGSRFRFELQTKRALVTVQLLASDQSPGLKNLSAVASIWRQIGAERSWATRGSELIPVEPRASGRPLDFGLEVLAQCHLANKSLRGRGSEE